MSGYYDFKCTNPECGWIEKRYKSAKRCTHCAKLIARIEPATKDEIIQSLRSLNAELKEDAERLVHVIEHKDNGYCQKCKQILASHRLLMARIEEK